MKAFKDFGVKGIIIAKAPILKRRYAFAEDL